MSGVFIAKGMQVSIPPNGLVIQLDDEEKTTASCTLHVHFDVCPTWIALAFSHLKTAQDCKQARIAAWNASDEAAKASTLEREFEASMQAVMSAAISLDAFYASIQDRITLPPSLLERWRNGRTARYAQIAEVLRRAFKLKPAGAKILRQNLKEIMRFRDLAIHPPAKLGEALLHPELNVGVEWRFVYFRFNNANSIVKEATRVIQVLVNKGKPSNPEIKKYCDDLKPKIEAYNEG